jgi:hypothetical protein
VRYPAEGRGEGGGVVCESRWLEAEQPTHQLQWYNRRALAHQAQQHCLRRLYIYVALSHDATKTQATL